MPDPSDRLQQMKRVLKEQGHRLTPQRLAVLKILAKSTGHPTVEEIFNQVQEDFPTTSLATIYKTVHLLKELGEVLELGFSDLSSRYDGHRPYPHPHAICLQCGRIVDWECSVMDELARNMARETGYRIVNHRLDFFGFCPECSNRE